MKHIIFLFAIVGISGYCTQTGASDLLIFSYHRPLQLYALLESLEKYVAGIENTYVIYRADQEQFELAYKQVFATFPLVKPLKENVCGSFYDLTITTIEDSNSHYFMFAVDDIVVKDRIDIVEGINLLEQNNAYAIFYRLGLHLSQCYPLAKPGDVASKLQRLPPIKQINNEVYCWEFLQGNGDWNYHHSVDMTLYRTNDVYDAIKQLPVFFNPNRFESFWARLKPKQLSGIFYPISKVVNIPFNRVQNEYENRAMNTYTVEELLDIFQKGFKLDILPLYQIRNASAHIDYEPNFIKREVA